MICCQNLLTASQTFRKLDDDMLDSMNEIDRKFLAAPILGVDITEVYSPERVAKVAARFGLRAGSSFDLTNGWDFNIAEHRRQVWSKIKVTILVDWITALHLLQHVAGTEFRSSWAQTRVDGKVR